MANWLPRALPYLFFIAGCAVIGALCRLPGWILTMATVVLTVTVIATFEAMDRHDNPDADG